ncbi:hypothetical protein HDU80_011232 [Chytriomyces hyalinus]|nr:hypothetical protein HDU80_011232 [Chytriomyces hyalinus]
MPNRIRSVFLFARQMSTNSSQRIDLTLYSRKFCGLCDHARDNILSLQSDYQFNFAVKDIDAKENKEWKEKYNYEVPVLHINDKPAFMNAVPVEDLANILSQLTK